LIAGLDFIDGSGSHVAKPTTPPGGGDPTPSVSHRILAGYSERNRPDLIQLNASPVPIQNLEPVGHIRPSSGARKRAESQVKGSGGSLSLTSHKPRRLSAARGRSEAPGVPPGPLAGCCSISAPKPSHSSGSRARGKPPFGMSRANSTIGARSSERWLKA
jgi:hypothetical protein